MLEKEKSTYVCLLLSNRYLCTVRIHRIHHLGANNCSLSHFSTNNLSFPHVFRQPPTEPTVKSNCFALVSLHFCTFCQTCQCSPSHHHSSPYFPISLFLSGLGSGNDDDEDDDWGTMPSCSATDAYSSSRKRRRRRRRR